MFGFIAKHRGIWPVGWMCGALVVSRSGFFAWLVRPTSARNRSDEAIGSMVRESFVRSDRTYGAAAGLEGRVGGRRVMRLTPHRAPDAPASLESTPAPAAASV